MRFRSVSSLSAAALCVGLALAGQPAGAQDFDPAGRRHKPGTPTAPPSSGPKAPRNPGPGTAPPRSGGPEAAEGKSGPGSAVLIARYTAIVLAQPTSPFPLQRLAQLYRDRDGNLKALVADFEKRAGDAGPEQWSAKVALATIYREDGRLEEAAKAYEGAAQAKPKDPAPLLALAQLARDRHDTAAARRYLEQALPLVAAQDREATLRLLLAVSLDLKDFDAAQKFHRELLKQSQNSLLVRGELGRELEARGEHERAESEFRGVVAASAGDNRTLAPALRDLGRVLSRERKNAEALTTLKRALAAAGGEAGVRGEIFALISDVYRSENNLGELIRLIEDEHPTDFQRLVTLGALYEETGQVDKALVTDLRATSTCASSSFTCYRRKAISRGPSANTRR